MTVQGTVQGILSGVRGLCQGIGPAVFGFIFYLFNLDMTTDGDGTGHIGVGPAFPLPHIRIQPFESKVITPTRNTSSQEKIPSTDRVSIYLFLPLTLLLLIPNLFRD